jgi:hypothetical protein
MKNETDTAITWNWYKSGPSDIVSNKNPAYTGQDLNPSLSGIIL